MTLFLKSSLKGVEAQCQKLLGEIRHQVAIALFRETTTDLFGRLVSPRKRAMSGRHVQLLNVLLDREAIVLSELSATTRHFYQVKNPHKALIRDLNYLVTLGAVEVTPLPEGAGFLLAVNLEWPTQITETEFFRIVKEMPKAKVHGYVSS